MSACAEVKKGKLSLTTKTPEECTSGYILLDSAEYQDFQSTLQSSITVDDLFSAPEPELLREAFETSFGLVLTLWLVSWGFGIVINFFRPEQERY